MCITQTYHFIYCQLIQIYVEKNKMNFQFSNIIGHVEVLRTIIYNALERFY